MDGKSCIHHTLYKQLTVLARLNPTSREFKQCLQEGMFKKANQKGFNEVIYFLLNLIDPKKCKQKLPWPLLDKKSEREFRKEVIEFISDITKSSEVNIPSITASTLHSPYGDKIVMLLMKLAKYVMKKLLNEKYNVPEVVQQPSISNPIVKKVADKLLQEKIASDARSIPNNHNSEQYLEEMNQKIRCVEKDIEESEERIKQSRDELKGLINLSTIPIDLKQRMLNNDNTAFEEFSTQVEEKVKEKESQLIHLKQLHEKFLVSCEKIKDTMEWNKSPTCLDKDKILMQYSNNSLEKLAQLCSDSGELSLEELIAYSKDLAGKVQEVIKTDPQEDMLPHWISYSEELENNLPDFQNLQTLLDDKLSFFRDSITKMQSELYPQYEDYSEKLVPDEFFQSPELNNDDANLNSTMFYQAMESPHQLITEIKQKHAKKRRKSVLCSIKQRRSFRVSKIPRSIRNKITKSSDTDSALSETNEIEPGNKEPVTSNEAIKASKKVPTVKSPKKRVMSYGNTMTKKRRSRASISPKLSTIQDYIGDISFTGEDSFFLPGSSSNSSRKSSGNLVKKSTSKQTLEESSMQNLSNPFEDISQQTASFLTDSFLEKSSDDSFAEIDTCSSDVYFDKFLEERSGKKVQDEQKPKRRDSIQALIDRFNAVKEGKTEDSLTN